MAGGDERGSSMTWADKAIFSAAGLIITAVMAWAGATLSQVPERMANLGGKIDALTSQVTDLKGAIGTAYTRTEAESDKRMQSAIDLAQTARLDRLEERLNQTK